MQVTCHYCKKIDKINAVDTFSFFHNMQLYLITILRQFPKHVAVNVIC